MTIWRSDEPLSEDIADLPASIRKANGADHAAPFRVRVAPQTVAGNLEDVRSYCAFERAPYRQR
jgi:hypothetical protein